MNILGYTTPKDLYRALENRDGGLYPGSLLDEIGNSEVLVEEFCNPCKDTWGCQGCYVYALINDYLFD